MAHGGQSTEIDRICEQVSEFCRHSQGQARLPCSAGACQRHQAYISTMQELSDGSHFLLPSNEWRWLNRQIVGMRTEGVEGWKIVGQARDDELEEVAGAL